MEGNETARNTRTDYLTFNRCSTNYGFEMKKIYVFFLLATIAMASCGRNNYTCPVYSKNEVKGKVKTDGYASARKAEKSRM